MPFCSALTNHACASINRTWLPCCRFIDAPFVDIHKVPFHDYRSSEWYQSVVETMKDGWHEGCRKCQQEEEAGSQSLRDYYNGLVRGENGVVELLELSLSNHCNLACRMCGPTYSTKWQKTIEEHPELKQWQDRQSSSVDIDKVLNGIDTEKLRWVKYLGGEPFITPDLRVLFDRLEQEGVIGNVEFMCHTNATLFPEKWMDVLSRFKKVNLKFSLDGIGSLGEYIRPGKEWSLVHSNVLKWKSSGLKRLSLGIYPTVQAYNVHAMQDMEMYARLYGLYFSSAKLMQPAYLSVNVLPKEYVNKIRSPFNEIYLKHHDHDEKGWQKFISYTLSCDKAFGRSMEDVNPLLWSYMVNSSAT